MLASMSLQGIRHKKTIILYLIKFLALYNIPYLPEYETRIFVVSVVSFLYALSIVTTM